MTKEDLILSMFLLISNNDADNASQLIWKLWMEHGRYQVADGKVVHRETGEEISL